VRDCRTNHLENEIDLDAALDALSAAAPPLPDNGGRTGNGTREPLDCPPLTLMGAAAKLITVIAEAGAELKERFQVDVALVFVDTVAAAAGYVRSDDESDAAVGQKIMSALARVSQNIGALVLAVDHLGKDQQVGTRGTSAKESRRRAGHPG
jgi:hypothetical protein